MTRARSRRRRSRRVALALTIATLCLPTTAGAVPILVQFGVQVDGVGGPECDPPGNASCPFLPGESGVLRFALDTADGFFISDVGLVEMPAGSATLATGTGTRTFSYQGGDPELIADLCSATIENDGSFGDVIEIQGVAADLSIQSVRLTDPTGTAIDAADLVDRAAFESWLLTRFDASLFASGTFFYDVLQDGSGAFGTVDVANALRTVVPIPEPRALLVFGLGLALAARMRPARS